MKKPYDQHILELDKQVAGIIGRAQAYLQGIDEKDVHDSIQLAYEFAKEAHKKDSRLSGEPYISHPVAATEILLGLTPDIATIQACLLHDVIEDTPYTYDDIVEMFGTDVADLCSGMEKLEKVRYTGEDRAIGSLRKMFIAMAEDLRVIFIKLSDRLHNMQTLKHHPKPEKRKRIALETLNIYVPIAGRLGLYNIKDALEQECFKILLPQEYKKLLRQLKQVEEGRTAFKNSAILEIQKILGGIDMAHKVDFRVKSPYSIYKKMQKKNIEHPKDLYDIYGIRIIVPSIADCYKVLGEIHGHWHTLPYRFKDYIALPKPNGYQSIHTTVVGFLRDFTSQPTEIQIRTEDMHRRAEIGVAAHFEYKEKGSNIARDIDWVKDLKDTMENVANNTDLIDSLKIDVFKNRIFVFTPRGDLINLPVGSTPIDFAYNVHTDIGDHAAIAKVNGVVQPLDKELVNGDVIEIVIDKNRKPSEFWLGFVKTIKAKNNIKSFLRRGNKEAHRDRGKEIMNRYLEKSGLPKFDKDLTVLKNIDDRELNTEERLQLLEQVGNFSITPASLLKRILKSLNIRYESTKSNEGAKPTQAEKTQDYVQQHVIIGGESNIPYKLCKNCIGSKKIPEKIVSHINSRGQFTIHKRSCKVLLGVNKERLMNAYISGSSGEQSSIFHMSLTMENKMGMIKQISDILFAMQINIDELHTEKISPTTTILKIGIEVPDYDYLLIDRFVERLKFVLGDTLQECKVTEIQT